jgi:hypothetical protein
MQGRDELRADEGECSARGTRVLISFSSLAASSLIIVSLLDRV